MKKKCSVFLTVAMIVVMILSMSVFTVSAATTSGQCGNKLKWSFDSGSGTLTVSGSGNMWDYEEFLVYSTSAPWEQYRNSIRKVVIGDGVTSVGNWAFYGCQNIRQVSFPDTLKSIGNYAFGYASISSVLIPKSVTSIGENALGYSYSSSAILSPKAGFTITGYSGSAAEKYYKKVLDHYKKMTGKSDIYFAALKSGLSFYDVYESSWFGGDVKYAVDKGWMNGVYTHYFYPDATTTRAQAVTILYRLAGSPSVSGRSFSDVSPSDWYYRSVEWAFQKGIVSGYGYGKFGPNDTLNRQQLATMLYRYAQFKRYRTNTSGSIYVFMDASQVNPYAVEAMNWAIGKKLISGTSNNWLSPNGSATRAQLATILHRFSSNVS